MISTRPKFADSVLYTHLEMLEASFKEIANNPNQKISNQTASVIQQVTDLIQSFKKAITLFDGGKKPSVKKLPKLQEFGDDFLNKYDNFKKSLKIFNIEDEADYKLATVLMEFLRDIPKNAFELVPFVDPQAVVFNFGLFSIKLKENSKPDDYNYVKTKLKIGKPNKTTDINVTVKIQEICAEMTNFLLGAIDTFYKNPEKSSEYTNTVSYYKHFKEKELQRMQDALNPYKKILEQTYDDTNEHPVVSLRKIEVALDAIDQLKEKNEYLEWETRVKQFDTASMDILFESYPGIKDDILSILKSDKFLDTKLPDVVIGYNGPSPIDFIEIKPALIAGYKKLVADLAEHKIQLRQKQDDLIQKKELLLLKIKHSNNKIEEYGKLISGIKKSFDEITLNLETKGNIEYPDITTEIKYLSERIELLEASSKQMCGIVHQLKENKDKFSKESESLESIKSLYQDSLKYLDNLIGQVESKITQCEKDKSKVEEKKREKELAAASMSGRLGDIEPLLKQIEELIKENAIEQDKYTKSIQEKEMAFTQTDQEVIKSTALIDENYKKISESLNECREIGYITSLPIPVEWQDIEMLNKTINDWDVKIAERKRPIGKWSPVEYIELLTTVKDTIEKNTTQIPFTALDEIYYREYSESKKLQSIPRDGYIILFEQIGLLVNKSKLSEYRNKQESRIIPKIIYQSALAEDIDKLIASLKENLESMTKDNEITEKLEEHLLEIKKWKTNIVTLRQNIESKKEYRKSIQDNLTEQRINLYELEKNKQTLTAAQKTLFEQIGLLKEEEALNKLLASYSAQTNNVLLLFPHFDAHTYEKLIAATVEARTNLNELQRKAEAFKRTVDNHSQYLKSIETFEERLRLQLLELDKLQHDQTSISELADAHKKIDEISETGMKKLRILFDSLLNKNSQEMALILNKMVSEINIIYDKLDKEKLRLLQISKNEKYIQAIDKLNIKIQNSHNMMQLWKSSICNMINDEFEKISIRKELYNLKSYDRNEIEKFLKSHNFEPDTDSINEIEKLLTEPKQAWIVHSLQRVTDYLKPLYSLKKSINLENTDPGLEETLQKSELMLQELRDIQHKIKERTCLVRVFKEEMKSYLESRHERFWLRDFFRFSDRKKRERYINELNSLLDQYIETGDKKGIEAKIAEGERRFGGQVFVPMVLQPLKIAISDLEIQQLENFNNKSKDVLQDIQNDQSETKLSKLERDQLVKIFDIQYSQYKNNKNTHLRRKDHFLTSPDNVHNHTRFMGEVRAALLEGDRVKIQAKIDEGKGKFGGLILIPIILKPLEQALAKSSFRIEPKSISLKH